MNSDLADDEADFGRLNTEKLPVIKFPMSTTNAAEGRRDRHLFAPQDARR